MKFKLESRRRSDLRDTLTTLPSLLDPFVGLIRALYWYPLRATDPQFHHCHARLSDVPRINGRICAQLAGGTSLTREPAQAKAIGEAVERYSVAIGDLSAIPIASYTEMLDRASDGEPIDPRRFVLFHPQQYQRGCFPFKKFDAHSRIGWVDGYSLTRDLAVKLPATAVHSDYILRGADNFFDSGNVSGYACGNSYEEAILSGLYEVVERDAFMIWWYNWLARPAIDLAAFDSLEIKAQLDRFRHAPVQIYCTNISSDIDIPVVLTAMISQQPGWPAAVVATAADLNIERAIIRSLYELSANHLFVRGVYEHRGFRIPRATNEVRSEADHGLYYCALDRLSNLTPIWQPASWQRAQDLAIPPIATNPDIKAQIDYCVAGLARLDLEVIVVDLTTPDIGELGFKTVKVVIPGVQPIDFGMTWQHLGGARLTSVPARLGYRSPRIFNQAPHPFS